MGLCGGLARTERAEAAAVGWRSRRRINMLAHLKEGRKSENGGEITAQSYMSLFGRVNIDAHDTGDVAFEVINKRP